MCGIVGLRATELTPGERTARVAGMLHCLEHRGPDGFALWDGDGITIGLARLAIVAPHLPTSVCANEGGGIQAVVNGEIYNHALLRNELTRSGHRIPPGPDTAVFPHLYESYGLEFPAKVDGMFAAALWDQKRQRLVLVRDRAGEKPLFYSTRSGMIAFASEPRALLTLPWVSRDPSPGAIARYLTHGYFAGSDCAFASIRQLPPAHLLEFDADRETRVRYWRPWDALSRNRELLDGAGDDDLTQKTRVALEESVVSRLPEESSFGILLSGGIDSGLIAALAGRRSAHVPTFTLRMAHQGYDESAFARLTAKHINSIHHEVTMDAEVGIEALDRFAQTMDQPLGDPSLLPTWTLARLAAQHVSVVLSGEGGDELFAGYPTYLGHRWAPHAARIPSVGRTLLGALAARLRPAHHHVTVAHVVERFLAGCRLPPYDRHHAWFGVVAPEEAIALLAPGLRASLAPSSALQHIRDFETARASATAPVLADYQMMDLEHYLGAGLLTKMDRCTMWHGLESRAPFLRPSLIEFAVGLPDRIKLRGNSGKWVLKRLGRELLPMEILARRKQGFAPPFSSWARGTLRTLVSERLSPHRIARTGILDPDAIQSLLRDHQSGRAERGRALWTVLSLQMWAERWVTGASGAGLPTGDAARDVLSAGSVTPSEMPASSR